MNALLYQPTFQMEMKRDGEGKILYQDLQMTYPFLGGLLQGKRLECAPLSVGIQAKYLRGLIFTELGKTLSSMRIPLFLSVYKALELRQTLSLNLY